MDKLRVDLSLLMRGKGEFGAIILQDAHVGGQIDIRGSKVAGTLDMDSLRVDQSLLMYDKAEFGQVELINAHVGGQISLAGSKVTGTLDMDSLQVASTVYLGDVAEFDGPIRFIFGKVAGNVDLAGGLFKSTVDLTGTQIGGELRLGLQNLPARWATSSALILRNAEADAIQDLSNSWPDKLDLSGYAYRGLGGLFAAEKARRTNPPALGLSASDTADSGRARRLRLLRLRGQRLADRYHAAAGRTCNNCSSRTARPAEGRSCGVTDREDCVRRPRRPIHPSASIRRRHQLGTDLGGHRHCGISGAAIDI